MLNITNFDRLPQSEGEGQRGVPPPQEPPPPLRHDLNFEITPTGYEVWFSDRFADDHSALVDQCADWLEDEVGVVNLGQIDRGALLADVVLGAQLKQEIVAWWSAGAEGSDQRQVVEVPGLVRVGMRSKVERVP